MSKTSSPELSRRTVFAGAGAVGALAVVATVLPSAEKAVADKTVTSTGAEKPSGGYQLTDHVKQYYASARV